LRIQEFENKCFKELNFLYSSQEIASLCKYAYQEYLGNNWPSEILDKRRAIRSDKQKLFEDYLNQLTLGNPYQYIFGYAEFYGLRLKVGEGVLIPRPETEQLVDWVLEDFGRQDNLTLLDACCGSGAISIALSKHLDSAHITGIDSSEQALKYAVENDKVYQSNLQWIKQDLFDFIPKVKFDIIVSNPPYVRYLEKKEMHLNVLNKEPHKALFVSDSDPLVFYERLRYIFNKYTRDHAVMYLECNQYLKQDLIELYSPEFIVESRNDFRMNFRMLKLSKKQ
jgi:release factor glutamine methyltransferase